MAIGWILLGARLFAPMLTFAVLGASHQTYTELGQSKSGDVEIVKAIDYDTEVAKQQRKKIEVLPEKVCYTDVGCFSRWDRMTHPVALPQDPQGVRTQFHFYNRENRDIPAVITEPGPRSLVSQAHFFREPKKLVVLLHGFTQSVVSLWLHHTKAALLKKEDVNVILVDWSNGCRSPNYFSAVGNSALIGRQVSLTLQSLVRQFPDTVDPARVHVIGFSLGGQASGFCGRHFLNSTGRRLGRITALDPAGPLFEDSDVRVSKADAHFVDIIHTSYGWNMLNGDLGMQAATGHVDFYPNFQERQPGCDAFSLSCRHRRAHVYFVESLVPDSCKFVSRPCLPDTADPQCDLLPRGEMGYGSEHAPGRGEQFLRTNYEPPFCLSTALDDTA
ncbi:pancreatic lipase-related protein 2-like [Amblyomma americanum]|uniref:Lipase domain-containing protein n=1 Tax=Amblyomma americanum TaxID=6943 RepID=A0AAQ4EAX9_AMBAM